MGAQQGTEKALGQRTKNPHTKITKRQRPATWACPHAQPHRWQNLGHHTWPDTLDAAASTPCLSPAMTAQFRHTPATHERSGHGHALTRDETACAKTMSLMKGGEVRYPVRRDPCSRSKATTRRVNKDIANHCLPDCNDPAEPAQVKRLMQMPEPGSSCRAPGAGAGGYKSVSSPLQRGWRAGWSRSDADARIVLSTCGSRVRPCRSAAGSAA